MKAHLAKVRPTIVGDAQAQRVGKAPSWLFLGHSCTLIEEDGGS